MNYTHPQPIRPDRRFRKWLFSLEQLEERNAPLVLDPFGALSHLTLGGLGQTFLLGSDRPAALHANEGVREGEIAPAGKNATGEVAPSFLPRSTESLPGSSRVVASASAPASAAAAEAEGLDTILVSPFAPHGGGARHVPILSAETPAPPRQSFTPGYARSYVGTNGTDAVFVPPGSPRSDALDLWLSRGAAGNGSTAGFPPGTGGPNGPIQESGSLEGQTGTAQPQFAQAPLSEHPPELTKEQAAILEKNEANAQMPTPPLALDPSGKVSEVPMTEPAPVPTGDGGPGVEGGYTDFTLFRRVANTVGPQRSATGSPAAGSIGRVSFHAGNWFGAVSGDHGANFGYVNPFTLFPATGDFSGGFCCNQRVATAVSRGMVLWYLEYNKNGSTATSIGGVRIAVANSTTRLADSAWTYYNLTPENFGQGRGKWMNFPHFQVSNNFLYATSNVFLTTNNAYSTALLWRIPLAQLQAGGSISFSYWVVNNGTSLPLSSNATSTMFSASHINTTNMRVFWQFESDTTIRWQDRGGLSQTFTGTHTSLTVGNVNWTARADQRIQTAVVFQSFVVFLWNSAQGSGRPQPFMRSAVFRISDIALALQPDLWSTNVAWHWGALAGNEAGLAGPVYVGGPGFAPQVNFLVQDAFTNPLVPPPWTNYGGVAGTAGGAFGDYLSVSVAQRQPFTFVAGGVVMNGATPTPYYFWFGRRGFDPRRPAPVADVGDTLATSFNTNIGPLEGNFTRSNPTWSAAQGRRDVDMYRLQAFAGTQLYLLSYPQLSGGDAAPTIVRLFNSAGQELAAADPGTNLTYLDYRIRTTGTYYVGVSGRGNRSYNPSTAGSGAFGALGDYQLSMILTPVQTVSFRVTTTAQLLQPAGTPFSITVSALDSTGAVNPSYRGRVSFSTTDPQATLPGEYTFTAADNGVRTFTNGGTFRQIGARSVSVVDTTYSFIGGASSAVLVLPDEARTMTVTGFAGAITAGEVGYFLVSVSDQFGNPAALYRGRVQVTSTDPDAVFLPEEYTFVPVLDPGYHLFLGQFRTAGTHSITVTDINNPALTGTQAGIVVTPAEVSNFLVEAPSTATSGTPFGVRITARDRFGNVATNYLGQIAWATTDPDPKVVLPPVYTFLPEDAGVRNFPNGVTLLTPGFRVVGVYDLGDPQILGAAFVQVSAPGGAPGGSGGRSGSIGPIATLLQQAEPARGVPGAAPLALPALPISLDSQYFDAAVAEIAAAPRTGVVPTPRRAVWEVVDDLFR